jgi:hypothetical protein
MRIPLTIGAGLLSGVVAFSALLAVAAVYDPKVWNTQDISDRRKRGR